MLNSYWNRLCLIGLIICCAALGHAQTQNISHSSDFMKKMGTISGFASSGQYAYVLGRNSIRDQFINTYDVSDIMNITFVSTTALEIYDNTLYHAVLVYGNRLFVFRDFGLVLCDISQPANPVPFSTQNINGNYQAVALYGDHLLTLYNRTLITWDIASNSQPQIEDYLVYPEATSLYLSGSNAIIGTHQSQYMVVDLSDPTNLEALGTNQNPVAGVLSGVSGSNFFFLAQFAGVAKIYDASVVLEPVLLGSVGAENQGTVESCAVQGTKLAMSYADECPGGCTYSCAIYEVGDPTSPALIDNEGLSHNSKFLCDGEHRLILSNSVSFQFLDFTQNQLFGDDVFNSSVLQIAGNATHAFTYALGNGVASSNLNDPLFPVIEDQVPVPDLNAICIKDNLLVTSQGHFEDNDNYSGNIVKLHDISSPGNIQTIASFCCLGGDSPTREISIANDKLLLFNGSAGVEIYDIKSPAEPNLLLQLSDDYAHISGILEGNYLYSGAYTSSGTYSVNIYDITDPVAPVAQSTIPVSFEIKRIQKSGSLLFMADWSHAIKIYDLTDPLSPLAYGEIDVSASVMDFKIMGQALVTVVKHSQYDHSLLVFKISNPREIVLAGMHPGEGGAECLALSGSYALIGTDNHVALYDCSAAYDICETSVQDQHMAPSALQLSCYPNPFCEKVNISVDLPESGMLALDIYNIRGQKVKSLDPVYSGKGVNTVYWDAQADLSSALPAGIYILKAKSGSYSASTRIVLLK